MTLSKYPAYHTPCTVQDKIEDIRYTKVIYVMEDFQKLAPKAALPLFGISV